MAQLPLSWRRDGWRTKLGARRSRPRMIPIVTRTFWPSVLSPSLRAFCFLGRGVDGCGSLRLPRLAARAGQQHAIQGRWILMAFVEGEIGIERESFRTIDLGSVVLERERFPLAAPLAMKRSHQCRLSHLCEIKIDFNRLHTCHQRCPSCALPA
jgi:hypothetical protein